MFICIKSNNIEGNEDRRASYLVSADAKYFSGQIFFNKYVVTTCIRELSPMDN